MLPLGLADMRRRDTTSSLVGCVLLGGVVSGRGADPDQSSRLYMAKLERIWRTMSGGVAATSTTMASAGSSRVSN